MQVKADFFDEMPSIAGLSSSSGGGARSGCSFGGDSVPALGMAWGYCVNTRITLHRDSAHCRACPVVPLDDGGDRDAEDLEGGIAGAALAGTKRPAPQFRVYAVDAEQRRQQAEDFYGAGASAVPASTLTKSEDKENKGRANVVASSGDTRQLEKDGARAGAEGKLLPLHERVCYYAGDQLAAAGAGGGSGAVRSARLMRLQLSPVHGPAQVAYDIGALGVRGIE